MRAVEGLDGRTLHFGGEAEEEPDGTDDPRRLAAKAPRLIDAEMANTSAQWRREHRHLID